LIAPCPGPSSAEGLSLGNRDSVLRACILDVVTVCLEPTFSSYHPWFSPVLPPPPSFPYSFLVFHRLPFSEPQLIMILDVLIGSFPGLSLHRTTQREHLRTCILSLISIRADDHRARQIQNRSSLRSFCP
jgi:hypothetical protein